MVLAYKNNCVFLDTNVLINYFHGKDSYFPLIPKAIEDMLMTDRSFVIDSKQEKFLQENGFGDDLTGVKEKLGRRFLVMSGGVYHGKILDVYRDLKAGFEAVSSRRSDSKKLIVKKLKPPQFAGGYITKESFNKPDMEDMKIIMNATVFGAPIVVSFDKGMGAWSLVAEARRPIYENLGVHVPYILPMDYALCGPCSRRRPNCPKPNPDCLKPDANYPSLETETLKETIGRWREGLLTRKRKTKGLRQRQGDLIALLEESKATAL